MKTKKIINCVACRKDFPEKEKTMIWYAPYCRECAHKRSENILKEEKEEKARRKKQFENRVRKIVDKILEEKGIKWNK